MNQDSRTPRSSAFPLSPRAAAFKFGSPSPLFSGGSAPASGVLPPHEAEALDRWFQNLEKYEVTLNEMAEASADEKFAEEVGTIENWFKVLSDAEKTATIYSLLQHSNLPQVRFFIAVLQQMAISLPDDTQKDKQPTKGLKPPSLNLPLPNSPPPSGYRFNIHNNSNPDRTEASDSEQTLDVPDSSTNGNTSWASMVNTPLDTMFRTSSQTNIAMKRGFSGPPLVASGMPMLPLDPGMMGAMGISTEAQLLAIQMLMGGYLPPNVSQPQQSPSQQQRPNGHNWRSPSSAKYPGSALRSGGYKGSGTPKSSGPKTASSLGSVNSPREEDVDPDLLENIPAWLKSIRLHKYTPCFNGLTWKDMVLLDDSQLESLGVAALGARRRLLRTFELVKKKTGMEDLSSSPPSALLSSGLPSSTLSSSQPPDSAQTSVESHSTT